jgi:hypothetical protein
MGKAVSGFLFGHQRGLARLRHSGRRDGAACQYQTCVAAQMVAAGAPGRAPVFVHQSWQVFSVCSQARLSPFSELCPTVVRSTTVGEGGPQA